MYYIFKKDQFVNYIPCYAAQTPGAATRFMHASTDQLYCMHVPGNKKTIIGL